MDCINNDSVGHLIPRNDIMIGFYNWQRYAILYNENEIWVVKNPFRKDVGFSVDSGEKLVYSANEMSNHSSLTA